MTDLIEWPETAVRPDYVTIAAMPDATDQLTGAVARFEFFPGEPIREVKLVRADQGFVPGPRTVVRRDDQLLLVTTAKAREQAIRRVRSVSRDGRMAGWTTPLRSEPD